MNYDERSHVCLDTLSQYLRQECGDTHEEACKSPTYFCTHFEDSNSFDFPLSCPIVYLNKFSRLSNEMYLFLHKNKPKCYYKAENRTAFQISWKCQARDTPFVTVYCFIDLSMRNIIYENSHKSFTIQGEEYSKRHKVSGIQSNGLRCRGIRKVFFR